MLRLVFPFEVHPDPINPKAVCVKIDLDQGRLPIPIIEATCCPGLDPSDFEGRENAKRDMLNGWGMSEDQYARIMDNLAEQLMLEFIRNSIKLAH